MTGINLESLRLDNLKYRPPEPGNTDDGMIVGWVYTGTGYQTGDVRSDFDVRPDKNGGHTVRIGSIDGLDVLEVGLDANGVATSVHGSGVWAYGVHTGEEAKLAMAVMEQAKNLDPQKLPHTKGPWEFGVDDPRDQSKHEEFADFLHENITPKMCELHGTDNDSGSRFSPIIMDVGVTHLDPAKSTADIRVQVGETGKPFPAHTAHVVGEMPDRSLGSALQRAVGTGGSAGYARRNIRAIFALLHISPGVEIVTNNESLDENSMKMVAAESIVTCEEKQRSLAWANKSVPVTVKPGSP